jgi:hypothetical protein
VELSTVILRVTVVVGYKQWEIRKGLIGLDIEGELLLLTQDHHSITPLAVSL